MMLESADPERFVPHVDLTKVAEYAAKAGGPEAGIALPERSPMSYLAAVQVCDDVDAPVNPPERP